MKEKKHQISGVKGLIRGLEGLLEVAVLTAVYFLLIYFEYDFSLFPSFFGYGKLALAAIYAVLATVLLSAFDGLLFGYLKISDMLISQWISLFITNFISYWQLCLIANRILSPVPMLKLMGICLAVALISVIFYTWVYHKIYAPKKMAMVLGRRDAISLKFKMETRPDKYHISKIIPVEDGLESICRQISEYEAVIINDVPAQIRNEILKFCYHKQIRTYVTPKLSDIIVRGAADITLFDTPLLLVKGNGLTPSQRIGKRLLDLGLCLPAMLVLAPVMLVVAIAVKIEDGGPVFYKQERVTLNGRPFKIIKFRSMIVDAEKNGVPQLAQEHDPRITKVGRFIRACRLDEIPQILNIIKGDMSIVGPRPERQSYIDQFCQETPEFIFRQKAKGGLTGYAQIYGKYNTSPYDKVRMDLMYIENYSLTLDIKLILMTLRILLKKESTEGFSEETQKQKEEALPGGKK